MAVAVAITGGASSASAQVFLQTERAEAYVPLASRPVTVTPFTFSSTDEGTATLTLPFPFRFFGVDQTSVWVSVNGVLQFGGGSRPSFNNRGIDSSAPDGIIAAWWDDLVIPAASGHARTAVVGAAPNRAFVIEVEDWERFSSGGISDGAYQVWLYEGSLGRFEVRYDRTLTASENYSATVGYRSIDGSQAAAFRPCGQTAGNCNHVDYATLNGVVVGVQLVDEPELAGEFRSVPRGALPGAQAMVPITVRNLGPRPAVATTAGLWLSADQTLDSTDRQVGRISVPALPANSAVDRTVTATVPPQTPPQNRWLLLEVDSEDVVAEAAENNNVSVSATRFATAYDLAVAAVDTPTGANPGGQITVPITVANLGVPRVGGLRIELWASEDEILQPTDPRIVTQVVQLSGAPEESVSITGSVPSVRPGLFRVLVRLDPANELIEYNEMNNDAATPGTFPTGPDLVPTALTGPGGAAAGQTASFSFTVSNAGVAFTGGVPVTLKLSTDTLHDLTDPEIGTFNVGLTGQDNEMLSVMATVPANLTSATYYGVVVVDPTNQVAEISNGNNSYLSLNPIRVGPDLVATAAQGPGRGVPGDTVSVTTELGSVGAPFTGPVEYALYLSEDSTLDAQDISLGTFSVTMTAGMTGATADTRSLVLPAGAVGDLRLVVQVDPNQRIAEADEGNNLFAASTRGAFGVDLRVFSVDYDPDEVDPQDAFLVTATVRVHENPLAVDVPYRIFLSEDSRLDVSDRQVGSGVLPVTTEGNFTLTSTVDLSVLTPPMAPGDYDVFVQIDPNDEIRERQETNNSSFGFGELTVRGPNLRVAALTSDPQAFAGERFTVQLSVENAGDGASGRFSYDYYLARDGVLLEGTRIGGGTVDALAADMTVDITDTVVLSATLAPGVAQLGVVLDPLDRIDESEERDNAQLRTNSISVRAPVPDLEAEITDSSTAAAAGETLAATTSVRNLGFTRAADFTYAFVLVPSDDLVPEVEIGRRTATLDAGDAQRQVDVVDVPATVLPGLYRLAVVVDPDGEVVEVDENNNRVVGPSVEVFPPDLQVVTETLAPARNGVLYETDLRAVGGTVARTWRVSAGTLPAGVTLSAEGRLSGTPAADGLFDFEVEVTSGARSARRPLQLSVLDADYALEVVESPLPVAFLGRSYGGAVVAVGGQAPRTWVASGLPDGLTVTAAGEIRGVPTVEGAFTVRFTVRDGLGAQAVGTFVLQVIDPARSVRIDPSALPPGELDSPYCEPEPVSLFALGGVPPYRWSAEGLPDGLALDAGGALCGLPTRVGRFTFVATVVDSVGQTDTTELSVEIVSSDAVLIRTVVLPPAGAGSPYDFGLEVVGGVPPYVWRAGFGELPPGITLAPDGQLSGRSDAVGLYPFAVIVADARETTAVRALSIEVRPPATPTDGGGCRCVQRPSTLGPGLWLLVTLGGLGWVRRRQ